jgi:predicted transcriptional regulator of viral defense system
MKSIDFFETHPVFSHAEFLAARKDNGGNRSTSNNLLASNLAAGKLLRIRRGLYFTVPRGTKPAQAVVDPFLVVSHATDDAVIAYHAAFQFYGKTYSVWQRFHYLTRERAKPFSFRGLEFVPVQPEVSIRSLPDWGGGVNELNHAGGRVRVTSLERTLVEVLDAPGKGGDWEEIWRSLEMIEFFDLDAVIDYSLRLGSSLTVARVGFFLEQHRQSLMVEDSHLEALRSHIPTQPRYLDSARKPGKLVPRWNLIVPEYVLNRQWGETA